MAAPDTPACSKSGANANPVAGPPVRVTDPARTPKKGAARGAERPGFDQVLNDGENRRRDEKQNDLRSADASRATLAPNPMVVKKAMFGDRGERYRTERVISRTAAVSGLHGDEQPADDGSRDIVARKRRDRPPDRIANEERAAGER